MNHYTEVKFDTSARCKELKMKTVISFFYLPV